ncbi:MAG: GTP-binding protein [Candidatus Shapirobacteria bacterium]|jgi:translation initiation factor IF-2
MAKSDKNITYRPPIVTIMGHIDHGKTTLLDKIRSTSVWAKEAGGITQHISAYQAKVQLAQGQTSVITFIDTPGHAAFCQMRTRGVQVTDIVILVISAVDGIMAQTKECIDIIKKANLPFIVAINKIDLPGANLDKVKGQLVELGFTPEDYGGQLACIPVSAKTGEGIPKLLEMVILNAELLELQLEENAPFEGIVIESRVDKNRGPVAVMVVKKGIINIGDTIFYGEAPVKIKAMIDYQGQNIPSAGPSVPVEILGFSQAPLAGGLLTASPVVPNPALSLSVTSKAHTPGQPQLPIILKADVGVPLKLSSVACPTMF